MFNLARSVPLKLNPRFIKDYGFAKPGSKNVFINFCAINYMIF